MKKKYYGVFSCINDAKEALGRIKKESLNMVDLTVVYLDVENKPKVNDFKFEIAGENFLEHPHVNDYPRNLNWPGLQKEEIEGIGKIMIGQSGPQSATEKKEYAKKEFETIQPEILNNKIIVIIEAEPEVTGKIRYILESIGADIIED